MISTSIKDFLLVTTGRFLVALIGLVSLRLSTMVLEPGQYGVLALLIALQTFCGLFLINPVGQHINRNTHRWWDDGCLLFHLSQYRYYVLGVSLIGGVLAFLLLGGGGGYERLPTAIVLLFMVFSATWNATSVPMLNMLGFRSESVFWAVTSSSVALLVSIGLTVWIPGALSWFSGQAVGMALGALGAIHALRRHAVKYSRDASASSTATAFLDRKTVITYCVPLAIATGFMWVQLNGYRFAVEAYWGLEKLGFLAVGLLVASQIWSLAESLLMQFFYPMFFRRISGIDQGGGEQALSDLLNVLGPTYLILAGITILGAPSLVNLLVDGKYADSQQFVVLGAVIECCRVLGNLFGNAAQITRRTFSLAIPYFTGAVVMAFFMLLAGLNQADIAWAGGALVGGGLAMLGVMVHLMYREVRFSLDLSAWGMGAAGMLLMSACAIWIPYSYTEMVGSVFWLIVVSIFGGGVIFGILWNNKGLKRMLGTSLSALQKQ